jgi:hypothetical protein
MALKGVACGGKGVRRLLFSAAAAAAALATAALRLYPQWGPRRAPRARAAARRGPTQQRRRNLAQLVQRPLRSSGGVRSHERLARPAQ